MKKYPKKYEDEEALEEALSRPTSELVAMMLSLEGDIIFLGVAGKMGISMAIMAQRASKEAGIKRRIIGVSRFSSMNSKSYLENNGVETIQGDLLDIDFVRSLPDVKNVIYLAGFKFGTGEKQATTWAMNSFLPGLIVDKFKDSRIVALSTGCVYPLVPITSGGSKESDIPNPIGEYAQSCLGRERLFEFGSIENGTKIVLIRLNYSVEMRYGVLVDIATKVYNNEPIDVVMGHANVIWQGDANAMILRSLNLCESPVNYLNISGNQTIAVTKIAKRFGELMGREPNFSGTEADSALLSNVSKSQSLLGLPTVPLDTVIQWTAQWIMQGKPLLGKATHFEVRDGKY
ncbi:NAD-dependent epimerase/dehydratase family protein [Confluentibacter flavum]|uniref:Epimerase n=1 Tax=Confluentibacter flavum TaxID=1909700 RepID=A0A2N3HHP8_9FLAO|nr:NAD(P)-dependent oxidoreductase [Confluentibacter flavum]PKQ44424.1 epimerase [Confluentibacter flavum]